MALIGSPILNLFAKTPQPGQVKTRLQQVCSAAQAASIAGELVVRSVELVTASWPGEVQLHAWPDVNHRFFQSLQSLYPIQLYPQVSGHLGIKMQAAIARGIDREGAAAVMGCDVPHCPGEVLASAFEALRQGRNVIGRCEDGGYYFLGLTQQAPALFKDIRWGESTVAAATLTKAETIGINFDLQLPILRDIDRWEDLQAAAQTCHTLRHLLEQ